MPEEMTQEEVLGYIERLGKDISNNANRAFLMLEIARKRGIDASLENSPRLDKFRPTKEFEKMLVSLIAEVVSLTSELFKQGVEVTYEELDEAQK